MNINLGDRAKDRITGFIGIVVAEMHWLYGCRRLTLQPETLKDGKTQERESFDEPQLEVVERAVHAITPTAAHPDGPLQTGDVAQDSVTKFKGLILSRTTWVHGCVFIQLQPEGMKGGKLLDSHTFDELRLKPIKRGKIAPAIAHPAQPSYGPRDDQKALSR